MKVMRLALPAILVLSVAACTDLRDPVTPGGPDLRASLSGSGASVVFSNFGPGMAFDTDPFHGWTINGNLGPGIGRQAIAQQFTPAADAAFAAAQVPLTLVRGPDTVHVVLQADAAGLPGAVLEDIPVGGLTATPTILAAHSSLFPILHHGTPYWLTVVAPSDGVLAGWNWNSIGDVSAVTFAGTQGGSAAGPWSIGFSATRGAFEIDGTAPVSFVAAPDLDAAVLSSTVIEGTAIKLGFLNAPAGFQFAFDCGTGAGYGAFSTTSRTACPTVDDEQRSVRGETRDPAGAVTAYAAVVSVVNHNPHVVLSTTQTSPALVGAAVPVSGTFTDPGVLDAPWSWTIVWGDGSASSGVAGTQGGAIAASHGYSVPGSFTIKMTVRDKDGGTGKSNSVSVSVVAAAGSSWTSVAPLPTPRGYAAAGVVNGVVYAAGGGGNGIFGTVEAYDPVANSWTARAPLPTPRAVAAAGVINGTLYVVGGSNASVLGTLEAYDPATNVWTTRAPMPTPRWGLAAGVVNGVLYAVGGVDQNGAYVGTVEAYDPATNSWTTRASLPTPRGILAAGVVNGILYAVGGGNGSGNLGTVEAYDPATNGWTTRASLPTPRGALAAGVVNGILYAVGGSEQTGAQGTVEAYDPVADAWSSRPSQPTPRLYLAAGVVNGVLYAIGGLDHLGSISGVVEAYHP
jgi:N-acetylneuraminic acid mutarotase